jgi:hypothetical protein
LSVVSDRLGQSAPGEQELDYKGSRDHGEEGRRVERGRYESGGDET